MYIKIPKASANVDKKCAFSSLVSSYDHLYAMNDKNKTTHSCWFPILSVIHISGHNY